MTHAQQNLGKKLVTGFGEVMISLFFSPYAKNSTGKAGQGQSVSQRWEIIAQAVEAQ